MSIVELDKRLAPNLRFFEFEGNWKQHVIGDFYKNLSTGMTPSRRKPKYFKGNIPWITSGELNYNYINSTRENITEEGVEDTNLKLYPKDTFFIAITGLEAPGTRGKCAMNAVPATTNQSCLAFTQTDKIETKFLYYWYLKYGIRLYYKYAQGTKQQSFNNKIVEQFKLTIPEKEEQQKIANFLSAVDKRINLLEQKKTKLEEYKKGVLQKIFSKEIRFKPRFEDLDLPSGTVADLAADFPDWKKISLSHIGKTFSGLTGKSKEDFGDGKPYVQYKQIFDKGYIDTSECDFVSISESDNQNRVQYGDIFFTISSETANEICTSSVLLDHVEEMYLNSFSFGYRPNQDILNPSFARFYFRSESFRKRIIRLAQGSTRYNMSKSSFLKLHVFLPCVEEQKQIASFLTTIDDKIELVGKQIEGSKQFKKGLLQQMFV